MFAAPGYAVVAINPRGSTGYGQKFTDQISQDWTGRVYDDLMKGLDHALEDVPVPGRDAGGGGGRLVRRLHGQLDRRAHRPVQGPDQPRRRLRPDEQVRHDRGALVPRVGVRRPSLGEARALPRAVAQHASPRTSRRRPWSSTAPSTSASPTPRAWACSPALQRRGVPSRYVWFPDEGHWIAKPAEPDRLVARGAGVAGAIPEVAWQWQWQSSESHR